MKETSVNRVLYGSSFMRDSVSEDIFKDEAVPNGNSYASTLTGMLSKYQLTARLSTLEDLPPTGLHTPGIPGGGLKSLLNQSCILCLQCKYKTGAHVCEILTLDGRQPELQQILILTPLMQLCTRVCKNPPLSCTAALRF